MFTHNLSLSSSVVRPIPRIILKNIQRTTQRVKTHLSLTTATEDDYSEYSDEEDQGISDLLDEALESEPESEASSIQPSPPQPAQRRPRDRDAYKPRVSFLLFALNDCVCS